MFSLDAFSLNPKSVPFNFSFEKRIEITHEKIAFYADDAIDCSPLSIEH